MDDITRCPFKDKCKNYRRNEIVVFNVVECSNEHFTVIENIETLKSHLICRNFEQKSLQDVIKLDLKGDKQ